MTDTELSARIVAQLERFGADRYDRSHHPVIARLQGLRPRCRADCPCPGCVAWRALADNVLTIVEREPDPVPVMPLPTRRT